MGAQMMSLKSIFGGESQWTDFALKRLLFLVAGEMNFKGTFSSKPSATGRASKVLLLEIGERMQMVIRILFNYAGASVRLRAKKSRRQMENGYEPHAGQGNVSGDSTRN